MQSVSWPGPCFSHVAKQFNLMDLNAKCILAQPMFFSCSIDKFSHRPAYCHLGQLGFRDQNLYLFQVNMHFHY